MDFESETFIATTLRARDGAKGVDSDCTDTLIPVALEVTPLRANGAANSNRCGIGALGDPMLTLDTDASAAVCIAFHGSQDPDVSGDITHPLGRNYGQEACIAFDTTQITSPSNHSNPKPGAPCHTLSAGAKAPAIVELAPTVCITGDVAHTLKADGFDRSEDGTGRGQPIVNHAIGVRRIMTVEAARLQGFPDNHTLIPTKTWRKIEEDEVAYLQALGATVEKRGPAGAWYTNAAADGPQYKGYGNSMAVACMLWLGRRIDAAVKAFFG